MAKKFIYTKSKGDMGSMLWVSLLPIVVCFQGYMLGPGGSNYIINTYALLTIGLFLSNIVLNKQSVPFYIVMSLLLIQFIYVSLRGVLENYWPIRDYWLLFRAWLLFAVVFFYFNKRIVRFNSEALVFNVFVFFWFFVSISIVFANYFDVGYFTYPNFSSGIKFWFPATNELSFFYFVSFLVVYYNLNSRLNKILLIVSTTLVYLLIGTKIFIVFFVIFFSLQFLFIVKNRFGLGASWLVIMAYVVGLVLVLYNFENIAHFLSGLLVQYSKGAGYIDVKIQSVGVVSAMLGSRDFLMQLAFSYMENAFLDSDFIVGKTLTVFLNEFSIFRGVDGFTMIENDVLDLFFSYGPLAVLLYFVFLFFVGGLSRLFKQHELKNRDQICITLAFIMLSAGVLSGHVVFFTLPMFISAVVFGIYRRS